MHVRKLSASSAKDASRPRNMQAYSVHPPETHVHLSHLERTDVECRTTPDSEHNSKASNSTHCQDEGNETTNKQTKQTQGTHMPSKQRINKSLRGMGYHQIKGHGGAQNHQRALQGDALKQRDS